MIHTTCTCRRRRSASRVGRVAVVSGKQVTVAAAAAAASWSPAARRRAAAGRPGRRPLVLLHCKPREASGAALLLANRNKAMRIAHYEVILTGIDAPRWSQRIATPSQLCPAQASALFSAQDYSWVESRGLVQGTGRAKPTRETKTTRPQRGGSTKHRTPRRDRLPRDRWDVSRIALAAVLPVRLSRGWRAER